MTKTKNKCPKVARAAGHISEMLNKWEALPSQYSFAKNEDGKILFVLKEGFEYPQDQLNEIHKLWLQAQELLLKAAGERGEKEEEDTMIAEELLFVILWIARRLPDILPDQLTTLEQEILDQMDACDDSVSFQHYVLVSIYAARDENDKGEPTPCALENRRILENEYESSFNSALNALMNRYPATQADKLFGYSIGSDGDYKKYISHELYVAFLEGIDKYSSMGLKNPSSYLGNQIKYLFRKLERKNRRETSFDEQENLHGFVEKHYHTHSKEILDELLANIDLDLTKKGRKNVGTVLRIMVELAIQGETPTARSVAEHHDSPVKKSRANIYFEHVKDLLNEQEDPLQIFSEIEDLSHDDPIGVDFNDNINRGNIDGDEEKD